MNDDASWVAEVDHVTLDRAMRTLARLVMNEYPEGYSLAAIAHTWGGVGRDDAAALETVERLLRQTEGAW